MADGLMRRRESRYEERPLTVQVTGSWEALRSIRVAVMCRKQRDEELNEQRQRTSERSA